MKVAAMVEEAREEEREEGEESIEGGEGEKGKEGKEGEKGKEDEEGMVVTCMLQLPYPQHQDEKQGASISSYQSISAWDTRMKVAAMVKEVREGEG